MSKSPFKRIGCRPSSFLPGTMKLIRKSLQKDQSGDITLCPEDSEDLWACYNLIRTGDEIQAKSMRKVQKLSKDGEVLKGQSQRKLLNLKLKIDKVDFDPAGGSLRIKGQVVEDADDVSAGTFHTFDLELNRNFRLFKDEWDIISLDIIANATDPENKAEVGAVIMQEGLAQICLLTENMTVVRQRIETSVPRKKRGDNSGYEKGIRRFYELVYSTMLRNLTLDKLKAVLIASPGFLARGFYNYIFEQAAATGNKPVLKSKDKFFVTHSSSGHVHSLEEVLKNQDVQKQLADTKYGRETVVLDKFFKMLNDDDSRAWYGPKQVAAAVEKGAVSTLLITDTLFRANDIQTRRHYIELVESVRAGGGEVYQFSSLHSSGEQLDQITGIACILTFPVPELEDIDEDEDE
jgi:protein pelota